MKWNNKSCICNSSPRKNVHDVYLDFRLKAERRFLLADITEAEVYEQYGTHAELVADENGKYHGLWNAQAQYYTE